MCVLSTRLLKAVVLFIWDFHIGFIFFIKEKFVRFWATWGRVWLLIRSLRDIWLIFYVRLLSNRRFWLRIARRVIVAFTATTFRTWAWILLFSTLGERIKLNQQAVINIQIRIRISYSVYELIEEVIIQPKHNFMHMVDLKLFHVQLYQFIILPIIALQLNWAIHIKRVVEKCHLKLDHWFIFVANFEP